jgi:stage II sporulation protein D
MTESIENGFVGSAPQPWLLGVSDPYDRGPSSRWKTSFTFGAAAKRLQGLVNGSFRGIEVLKRGVSPRIVSALVLGSRGTTPISGPALAARLGLLSTWAYFSVKRGTAVQAEPDRSGRPASSAPKPVANTPSAPPTGPEGGAQAPGGRVGGKTGGVAAR